jgi:uncharacterized protein YneF (UPF0154 family)
MIQYVIRNKKLFGIFVFFIFLYGYSFWIISWINNNFINIIQINYYSIGILIVLHLIFGILVGFILSKFLKSNIRQLNREKLGRMYQENGLWVFEVNE